MIDIDDIKLPVEEVEPTESIFAVALRGVGPTKYASRALLQLLQHFLPDTPIDAGCITPDGTPIGGSEARTALRLLSDILGPNHGAVAQAGYDLRDELVK